MGQLREPETPAETPVAVVPPFALKSDHNMARQLRPLVPWSVSARQQSMAPVVAIAQMVAVWSLKKEMPDPDGEIV